MATTSIPRKTDAQDNKVNIGIDRKKRSQVAEKLAPFLASTYSLYLKSLYYHWNVSGPQFHGLHAMFGEQYEHLHQAGDRLAERIRALGHKAPGTFREFQELSSITEDKTLPSTATAMLQNLLEANEHCSLEAREVLKLAESNEDEVTVDMMVERMTWHDEAAWMIRATLENNHA